MKIIILFVIVTTATFSQYTSSDKDLVKTTYTREFNRETIIKYLNSGEQKKVNAALLSMANMNDTIFNNSFREEILNKTKSQKGYFDFTMTTHGQLLEDTAADHLISKLQSEKNNFRFAFLLYRKNPVPGNKEIYFKALKSALKKKDNKTIPYLLGCLRKLKIFLNDDKLISDILKLKLFDQRVEVVKVLPYGIKKESAFDIYLKFFEDKNRNIIRQAAISISEINEPFLLKRVNEFLVEKIKYFIPDHEIGNELLVSYIKLNKPSMKQVMNLFNSYVDARGYIRVAELIGDKDSREVLLKVITRENYQNKLFALIALEEMNKDSSLTKAINEVKQKYPVLVDLLNETGRPKEDFEKLWENAFKYKTAEIVTPRGKIKIKFLPEYAPMAVGNFCNLASGNYFQDNKFHRVVSGFVIQTGDTSNTGWGGAGKSITTEVSPISFNKGIVGMASSGKDTEGSQWFITTGNYPHLDGRYSVFGEVIKGMDVAELISQDDKIIAVKLLK